MGITSRLTSSFCHPGQETSNTENKTAVGEIGAVCIRPGMRDPPETVRFYFPNSWKDEACNHAGNNQIFKRLGQRAPRFEV